MPVYYYVLCVYFEYIINHRGIDILASAENGEVANTSSTDEWERSRDFD